MFLRLGLASADQRYCQQNRQYQRTCDSCSHRNDPLRVRRNPDESASNGAELSRRDGAYGTATQILLKGWNLDQRIIACAAGGRGDPCTQCEAQSCARRATLLSRGGGHDGVCKRRTQSAGIGRGKWTRSLATLNSSTSAPERANAPMISSTSHSGDDALAVRPSERTPSSIEGSTSAIESTRNARAPRIRATSTSRFAFELCFEPTTSTASLTCTSSLTAFWRFWVA